MSTLAINTMLSMKNSPCSKCREKSSDNLAVYFQQLNTAWNTVEPGWHMSCSPVSFVGISSDLVL